MLLRFFLLGPAHERLQRLGHLGRGHFRHIVIRVEHEARMDCRVPCVGRFENPVELKLRVHWCCITVVIAVHPGHVVILGGRPDCRHIITKLKCPDGPEQVFGNGRGIAVATILPDPSALGAALTRTWRALKRTSSVMHASERAMSSLSCSVEKTKRASTLPASASQ